MRRLWAHICIAAATLVAIFASFPSVLKGMRTDGDYITHRQFTFQLTERIDAETGSPVKELEENSAKELAEEMAHRLEKANVSSYKITTSGNDIVTASFYADTDTEYSNITTYLTFSGSFALMSADPDGEPLVDEEFIRDTVYQNRPSINEYPTIYIPLKNDSEAFTNIIKYAQDNPDEESSGEAAEGEEAETVSVAHLYIIYNYEKGDTYKSLNETNKWNEKLLLSIDVTNEKELKSIATDGSANGYAKDADGNYFFYQKSGYQDANGNSQADPNEVAAAYNQADLLINLFNSTSLDYEVKVIRGLSSEDKVRVEANVENLFAYGSLAWSSTLTAIIAAIVIISLLLVVFYRLSALSIITTTLLSSFLTFLLFVAIGLEFNSLALLGYIVVALAGLVSGVIYTSKLRDECYKGRTLKKANSEASKKSTLPIIDIHVVTLLIGLFSYLLGGAALHSFGSIVLLGSLISVFVSLGGLKGLFWLSTNTTKLTGKYKVFAVDEEKVPNHMQEEKQTYFGPYAEKDFSKKKKPVSIIALSLSVLALGGLIAMGAVTGGSLLKDHGNKVIGSEIFVVNTIEKLSDDSKETLSEDDVKTFLEETKIISTAGEAVTWDTTDTHASLYDNVKKIDTYTVTETIVGDDTKTYLHTYYQVSFKSVLEANTRVVNKNDGEYTITELLEVKQDDDRYSVASLKAVSSTAQEHNVRWYRVLLATSVAIATLTIYLFIRYRISRTLLMLVYPLAASVITLSLLALVSLGLALPSVVYAVIPLTAIISYFVSLIFANKERDLMLDEKEKNLPVERRLEMSQKAFGMSYAPALVVMVLAIYILINFFGFGPAVNSYLYLAGILAVLMSFGFYTVTYLTYSNALVAKLGKINLDVKPRKNKKKNKVEKTKSAEPEESIFIGIND